MNRFEFRVVRVMAAGTEIVGSFPAPKITGPFSVDTGFPVSIHGAVTFAAEPIALREIDELSIIKPELVAILCIVAVEAPSHALCMVELDVRMFFLEFPLFRIDLHAGMAVAARKEPFCNGRRSDRKLFDRYGKWDTNNQAKNDRNGKIYLLHSY